MVEIINKAEKEMACHIARKALKCLLEKEEKLDPSVFDLPENLKLEFSVAVVLWIDGYLRGSQIAQSGPLSKGIIEAVIAAARDSRFKPLEKEELENIRIEITIAGNDFILVDFKRIRDIDATRGYRLIYKNKIGWFLPEIFNIRKFDSGERFLKELAFEKARMTEEEYASSDFIVESFGVDGFIESSDYQKILCLNGPVINDEKLLKNGINGDLLMEKAFLAADWVLSAQNKDGDFTPIIGALGNVPNADWPRSTLTGWALAELGNKTYRDKYVSASQKNFEYTKRYFLDKKSIFFEHTPLVLAFLGQQALSLGHIDDAIQCAREISQIKEIIFEPIVFQQISSFLLKASYYEKNLFQTALSFGEKAKNDFEKNVKNSTSMSLAGEAELVWIYCELYRITKRDEFLEFAKKVSGWLLQYQLKTGGFSNTNKSEFIYTRGTAKIIEVLVVLARELDNLHDKDAEKYKNAIENAYRWILPMQYTSENCFFINNEMKKRIFGAFRHDYKNQDAWIDAAGHFILGVSRRQFPSEEKERILFGVETIYPIVQASILLEGDFCKMEKKYMFFKRRFLVETFMYKFAKWIIGFFAKKAQIILDEENLLGYEQESLRNYSYLFVYLKRHKIIANESFQSLLRYAFMEKITGFFTANIGANYSMGATDGRIEKKYWSRGFSSDWQKCLGQVFGEFLERYSHSIYKKNELLKASVFQIRANGKKYLHPKLFDNFSQRQKEIFPNKKWNEQSIFYWEKVRRYTTEELSYVPAQLVYWNYANNSDEPFLAESNTSGLGGFFTKEGAILSALYEVIQRDTFFFYWFSKKTPVRINPKSIPNKELQEKYKEITANGKEIIFLQLDSISGVPVFICIIENVSLPGPLYVLGAGCDADQMKALLRSYEEAWSIFYWLAEETKDGLYNNLPDNFESFVTKMNMNVRLSAWGNTRMKGKLDFFIPDGLTDFKSINNRYPKVFENEKKELEFAIREIEKKGKGYEVYVHFSENNILQDVGYNSVRVIIPSCIPMFYNEENAPAGHKRFKQIEKINVLPHLFP